MSKEKRYLDLTDTQFLEILKRFRTYLDTLPENTKPEIWDDNSIGSKDNGSNVGFCHQHDPELWNREEMLYPDQFPKRISVKYRQSHQKCPLEGKLPRGYLKGSGCFHGCLIRWNILTLQQCKDLYDNRIAEFEELINV